MMTAPVDSAAPASLQRFVNDEGEAATDGAEEPVPVRTGVCTSRASRQRLPLRADQQARLPRWVPVGTYTDKASRVVATSSLFHVCQRHYPGGNGSVLMSLFFPNRHRPSPCCRGGRLPHYPFRGLLSVYLCSGLRVVTGVLQPMSLLHDTAPAATNRNRQSLGGVRTLWEEAPFHGALQHQG